MSMDTGSDIRVDQRSRVASPVRRAARAFVVVLLALGVGVVGCDLSDPVESESLVVEAFIETGKPLPAIRLRQTRPLDQPGDSVDQAARSADVVLTLDGQPYPYVEAVGRPGRYVPVDAAPLGPDGVPPRVPFRLDVRWRGEHATAAGRTPPRIALTEVCVDIPDTPVRAILVDSLRRDSLDIPAQEGFIYPIDVTAQWSGVDAPIPGDTVQWVRAQLRPTASFSSRVVNFFLQPAEVKREIEFVGSAAQRQWTGVYAIPVNDSTQPLPRHRLTVDVTRGDTAFASFATSRTDPDRREPISNVSGGLGIATGVALDSLARVIEPGGSRCAP